MPSPETAPPRHDPPRRRGEAWTLIRWGSALALAFVLVAAAAPLLAPHDPAAQVDPAAARHRPPGTVLHAVHLRDGSVLLADNAERLPDGDLLLRYRGRQRRLDAAEITNLTADGVADRRAFLLGTDGLGRDVWSRIVYGARVSLLIALLTVLLAMTVGVTVGAVAAVAGSWLDVALMRGVDALLSFPQLFLIIALAALFGPRTWLVIVFLGLTGWMRISRLTRSEILGLKDRDFVLAAHGLGQRPTRILLRHLLPNALTPLVVEATLMIGDIILAEASLSFLGFGVQSPTPSWGNMIYDGRDALLTAWWLPVFPGAAIALAVISFSLLGDGLRDLLEPGRRGGASLGAHPRL